MKTRIEIGDRILWADNSQWVIGRRANRKNKDTGEVEEYDHGLTYYGRIDQALKALLDERLRLSGAANFEELRGELDRFRIEVADLLSV